MRVTIIAIGSRGDIQPFVPLGLGLQVEGHQVRIATFQEFAPMILNAGLDFFPLRGDARLLLDTAMGAGLLSGRAHPISFIRAIRRSYGSLADTLPDDLSDPELKDTEIILNQVPAYLFGFDLAEFLDIPWAIVSVIPLARSRYWPLIGFPTSLSRLPGYNKLTYRLGEQMAWSIFRKSINQWRRDRLGLPGRSYFGNFDDIFQRRVPIVNGYSPLVVPRLKDWGDHVHITGWWHPKDETWKPSKRLQKFLDVGEETIFIGFGSIPVADPQRTTSTMVDAVNKVGVNAVIHAGWAGLGEDLPERFFPISYAPYDWLFERMAAIVHHGGSGTTGFALRAGVPSVVVPFGFDQYFWGDRTAELGVGPNLLQFQDLNVEGLASRLHQALHDKRMSKRAADLGKKLLAEKGVENAVKIIDALDRQSNRGF